MLSRCPEQCEGCYSAQRCNIYKFIDLLICVYVLQPAAAGAPARTRAAPMLAVLPPMQPPDRTAFLDAGEAVLAPPAPPAIGTQDKVHAWNSFTCIEQPI